MSLVPTADTQVFGLHWRPWYAVKLAAHDGMDGMASFAGALTSAIFLLPTIALWLAVIVLSAAVGVRLLRWVWRMFFSFSKPNRIQPVPSA